MPRWEPYLLFVIFVTLPVAFGTRRGFARARGGAGRSDRNPGPEGSYAWIRFSLRRMPGWFNRAGMDIGTWVAWLTLPRQRACSREYLRLVLGGTVKGGGRKAEGIQHRDTEDTETGRVEKEERRGASECVRREPGAMDLWRHMRAYTEYLIMRLGVCNGEEPQVRFAAGEGDELRAFLTAGKAALYGTMHMGHSDMLGFYLTRLGGRVCMIRKKVGNSEDVDRLAERYGAGVSFIWINDWSRLVLAMNDALREGKSLALQCDRPEYSSKKEGFEFFGERRLFPFTIYHLAIMHGLPVVMSFAVPAEDAPNVTEVHVLPLFQPKPGPEHREENFAAARAHFQSFLSRMELQLRRTPFLWFNFTPLNPVCTDAGTPRRRAAVQVQGKPETAEPVLPPGKTRPLTV